ncbi:hypothetical protein GALMADRAFT_114691 [Galerina marginata CBS 339.88]|uniref:F-box domain-containing protein n=1 Tax=Galerina marginata (strain CBS 339.88) TaxID=685588 RepID=A0A067TPQ5_GALM3|nr:hypothetical protein GALMADRAFT_114691 [Galerina marginata CBS 339.88]
MDSTQPSPLTGYLLDSSLIDYTVAVTNDALRASDPALQEQTKKRAAHALEFFLDILNPSVEEEKAQLETFRSYHAALNDPALAESVLKTLPAPNSTPAKADKLDLLQLTPAQKVLSLPDTLDLIFSQIPLLTKSERDTIHQASLTSHAFHNATQLRLWRRPRDLDTVEQQVRFAFGAAISGAISESLGHFVQRLRIRIVKGGWNMRVVQKLASLTPNLVDLTLHWGDSADGPEAVTSESVTFIHNTLAAFFNLKTLYLAKFSYTPPIEGELDFPADAYLPFANLESIQLYGFHWYWEPISRGLGANLKSLDIGFGTSINGSQIADLSAKLTSLKSLNIGSGLELQDVRTIVENIPGLEQVDITNFSESEDTYVAGVVPLLASLASLKSLSLSNTIGKTQVDLLVASSAPLQDVTLVLEGTPEIGDIISKLLKAKKETLRDISFSFDDQFVLPLSDDFVNVLASIPNLQRISVEFEPTHQLSSAPVDALLKQCPNLALTDSLEVVVTGNALYNKVYKAKFEKARDEEEKEMEEDVLGN